MQTQALWLQTPVVNHYRNTWVSSLWFLRLASRAWQGYGMGGLRELKGPSLCHPHSHMAEQILDSQDSREAEGDKGQAGELAMWRTPSPHLRLPLVPFSLKAVLAGSPQDNTVDLSGIPLTSRDLERVTSYLQRCGEQVDSVELGFTGLTDDMVLQLLPALSTLPRLTTLALNGNRLTRAVLRDLTDTLKDPSKFPNVTWIDLGNNVDIFSLPQPFLLSLRKRSPKQGHLPTILELGEGLAVGEETRDGTASQEDPEGSSVSPVSHSGETGAAAHT